jgi:hypothetical protein
MSPPLRQIIEPEILSKNFHLSRTPLNYRSSCVTIFEGREPGTSVPHYLPGKNPFINEMTQKRGIPLEAVLGGPETIYPEYRKKLKDTYKAPAKCVDSCGGPPAPRGGGPGQGGQGAAPPAGRGAPPPAGRGAPPPQ